MTVPTNNEEREALHVIVAMCNFERNGDSGSNTYEIADRILAAGFRRLPVSGDNAEATEVAWKMYLNEHGYATAPTSPDTGADFSAGFEAGAQWQASQPREVRTVEEPSLDWWIAQHDGEFVETIRRHEREACALIAEKAWDAPFETDQGYRVAKLTGNRIAAAIRSVPSTPNQQGAEL